MASVGVFDSGVGGLSVLREIRRELPALDLLYVADSAFAPYGDKPVHVIRERSLLIADTLVAQGASAIVVACNTATSAAVHLLRERLDVPVIGIEPALKPAVAMSRSGVVGVLGTQQTLAGEKFRALVETVAAPRTTLVQACSGVVEEIERGDLAGERLKRLLRHYIEPLVARGADVLVLGCTHYVFVAPLIQAIAGPGVQLVDPAAAVARHLRRRLTETGIPTDDAAPGRGPAGEVRFWTTGDVAQVQPVASHVWGEPLRVEPFPAPAARSNPVAPSAEP